jgi:hypothetical protein
MLGNKIQDVGKAAAPVLIHQALPGVVAGTVGGLTTLASENPVLGAIAGQTVGKAAGNYVGDQVGKATGMGLRRAKMVKGSAEAKEYMKALRAKKGKK